MDSSALISVIVPVYKVEAYLPKCVESILAQTHSNLEIILVDDGSPDQSGKICEEYAVRDSRIRVIHKQNGGLSSARNAGLEIATGDYVTFVDSDDWMEPDAYEAMLSAAERYGVRLVCAGRYDVDGQTLAREPGLCPVREETVTGKELVSRIFRWDHLDSAAWDKLYGRELFDGIRYPDGKVVEDVPTTYRIALKAGKAVMLPKPVYNYLHRENSITTASISEKNFHFYQHTAKVYADICENYPELEPEAHYLRIRSLLYNVLALESAGEDAIKRFETIYRDSRRELRQHTCFLLTSPFYAPGERAKDLLIAYGLYWPLQRVYHFIKYRE